MMVIIEMTLTAIVALLLSGAIAFGILIPLGGKEPTIATTKSKDT